MVKYIPEFLLSLVFFFAAAPLVLQLVEPQGSSEEVQTPAPSRFAEPLVQNVCAQTFWLGTFEARCLHPLEDHVRLISTNYLVSSWSTSGLPSLQWKYTVGEWDADRRSWEAQQAELHRLRHVLRHRYCD